MCHFVFVANAQNVSLTGSVVNGNKEPLEFVYVSLFKNDSIRSAITMTDSLGQFLINIERGDYILHLEQFGQKLFNNKIEIKQDLNIGTIIVDESIHLEGVSVIYSKKLVERKIDRVVFNVDNTISAIGGDAVDMLKITPGLRVQNGTISMIGKSTVSIMINGRLLQLSGNELNNFLATVNSENIKLIEVINNPPAQYSAEGNSGLINIVLKDTKKNYMGGSIRSSYQISLKNKGYFGGDFTYQKNKISTFLNLSLGKGSSERTENMKIFYPNQLWEAISEQEVYTSLISGRVGLDYNLSNKSSLGVQIIANSNKPDLSETIHDNIYKLNNLSLDSTIITKGDMESKYHSQSTNIHFKTMIDTVGHNFTIDIDYLNYVNDTKRQNVSFKDGIRNDDILNSISGQKIKAFTSKFDLDLPIHWLNISVGGKLSILINHSMNDISNMNINGDAKEISNDIFDYNENTQSAYINLYKKLGKFELQGGLRWESTQTKGTSVLLNQTNNNNYMKIFPTLFVMYDHNEKNNYSLTYGVELADQITKGLIHSDGIQILIHIQKAIHFYSPAILII
jgi:hypothetical protein